MQQNCHVIKRLIKDKQEPFKYLMKVLKQLSEYSQVITGFSLS